MGEQRVKARFQAAAGLLGCTVKFDADKPRPVPFDFAYDANVRFCNAFKADAPRKPIPLAPLILEIYPTTHRSAQLNSGPIRAENLVTAKLIQRDFGRYMDWLRLVQIWRLSDGYDQANTSRFLRGCASLLGLPALPDRALRSLVRSATHDPRSDDSSFRDTWRFNQHVRVFPPWLRIARTSMRAVNPDQWDKPSDP